MTMDGGDARCSGGGGASSEDGGSETGDYGTHASTPPPFAMEVDNEDSSCSQDQTNNNTASAPPSVSPRNVLAPSSREMRNRAEKQRRDKLNTYVTELQQLNPLITGMEKKLDKTSVLRLSAAYIRLHQIQHDYDDDLYCCTPCCPPISPASASALGPPDSNGTQEMKVSKKIKNNEKHIETPNFGLYSFPTDLSEQMLEGMEGFLMILSATGKIIFVSHTITKLLGHSQNDLLGQSLFTITCPSDHDELRKNLQLDSSSHGHNHNNNNGGQEDRRQRRSFYIKLSQRATSRGEHLQYELVHVIGQVRTARRHNATSDNNVTPTTTSTQLARKSSRNRDGAQERSHQDVVLVAVGKLTSTLRRELCILDANKEEYVTRHTLDGVIIYCDHRISVVAGYMSDEVNGASAFGFMHREDVALTLVSLRQMYRGGAGMGSSVYRLLARNGEFIYLRTHGHLEFDETGTKPSSFICINTLLSEEEGEDGVLSMKSRFSCAVMGSPQMSHNKTGTENTSPADCILDQSDLQSLVAWSLGETPENSIVKEMTPPTETQYIKCAIISKSLPPSSIQISQFYKQHHCEARVSEGTRSSSSSSSLRANGRTTSMCSASPTESLGSTSPSLAQQQQRQNETATMIDDPLLAGAKTTCFVRTTRRRDVVSVTPTNTLTIENSIIGQVSSSSVMNHGVQERGSSRTAGGRLRVKRNRLNNKRPLSGAAESSEESVVTVAVNSKRPCTEPPPLLPQPPPVTTELCLETVSWEHSPTHSLSSNDTDFSSLLVDSSEAEDNNADFQSLMLGDLIGPLRGNLESDSTSLSRTALPQETNPSLLRRDILEDTKIPRMHQQL